MVLSDMAYSERDTQSVVPSDKKFFSFRFEKEESWESKNAHPWMLAAFVHAVEPESLKLGRGVCHTNTNNCRLGGFSFRE